MSKESPRNINQLDMPLLQDNITDLEMGLKEATGVSVAKTARSYGMETCDFMKYLLIMAQEVSTHALKIGANVTKSTLQQPAQLPPFWLETQQITFIQAKPR
jgi:hypothetical protein